MPSISKPFIQYNTKVFDVVDALKRDLSYVIFKCNCSPGSSKANNATFCDTQDHHIAFAPVIEHIQKVLQYSTVSVVTNDEINFHIVGEKQFSSTLLNTSCIVDKQ